MGEFYPQSSQLGEGSLPTGPRLLRMEEIFPQSPLPRVGKLPAAHPLPRPRLMIFPTTPLPRMGDPSHKPSLYGVGEPPSLELPLYPLRPLLAADSPSRSSSGGSSSSQPVVQIATREPAFLAGSMVPSCSVGFPPSCAASQPGPSYVSPG